MWRKVVPRNVSPNAPVFEYAAANPVNQSLVTTTDGTNLSEQRNSREALQNTEICLRM